MKKWSFISLMLFFGSRLFAQAYLGHDKQYIGSRVHITGAGTNVAGHQCITAEKGHFGVLTYYLNSSNICMRSTLKVPDAIAKSIEQFYRENHYRHPAERIWEYTDEFAKTVYIVEKHSENRYIIFDFSYLNPSQLAL